MPGDTLTIRKKSARLFDAGMFKDRSPSPDMALWHGARQLVTGLGRIASACRSGRQRWRRFVNFPEVTQGHMAMLHREKKRCIHNNVESW